MVDLTEIILRLSGATLIGAAIGLNRDLRDKPIGVRTLGLVGLASAIAPLGLASNGGESINSADASRVIQGVLTGIGFLGAGVIVRRNVGDRIHGLTSAACAWITACLGLACGLAAWPVIAIAVVLVFVLLVFGGPFERLLHGWLNPHTGALPEDEKVAKPGTSPE